jgi:hypothetical protein
MLVSGFVSLPSSPNNSDQEVWCRSQGFVSYTLRNLAKSGMLSFKDEADITVLKKHCGLSEQWFIIYIILK